MRTQAIILLSGLLLTGCSEYDIDEILLARPDVSLTMKGRELYSFNPDKGQISFNAEKNEYRMFDDDLGNRIELRFGERPSHEDQKLSVDVDWETDKGFKKEAGLEFEVKKTDENGQIWLWNDSDNIGIVIKFY